MGGTGEEEDLLDEAERVVETEEGEEDMFDDCA